MGTHTCHAMGCAARVPPRMLMCKRHWYMLPKPAQRVIWREYRPGQERTKDPSVRYLVAQSVAVMLVAVKDSRLQVGDSHGGSTAIDHLRDRWVGLPIEMDDAVAIYEEMLA